MKPKRASLVGVVGVAVNLNLNFKPYPTRLVVINSRQLPNTARVAVNYRSYLPAL
jgi:hypothetical protein